MMFTWWFRVARSSARERERARAEAHELRSLDAELRLARANAERDAAVERAEMTEKMYKAIEFRDRKDRLRDERIAEEETRACVRGAVATRSEPKKGARDGDQKRRALASASCANFARTPSSNFGSPSTRRIRIGFCAPRPVLAPLEDG